jgi:hypothetical protein
MMSDKFLIQPYVKGSHCTFLLMIYAYHSSHADYDGSKIKVKLVIDFSF